MKRSIFSFTVGTMIGIAALTTLDACKSKPKDADIESAIVVKTSGYPGLTATVKDGVATLSGTATDEAAKSNFEADVKGVEGVKSVVNNITVTPPAPQPAAVEIAQPDSLSKGVTDATKDFPTVNATIADGVVTLTGELERSKLTQLMQRINALKPKKVENKLKLK